MNTYTVRQFSERIGVSVRTVQRWDREGRRTPLRTPGNRRLYTDEHLTRVLAERGAPPPQARTIGVYLRVSSQAQQPDLNNQREARAQFCRARGIVVDAWMAEIGGGLNFKRPRFLQVIDAIIAGEIETVIVAHTDRLTRCGYDVRIHLCETHRCHMLVLNQETLSPEQEMVQDLMTIVQCFSSRRYGLRTYRTSLKEALSPYDTSAQNPPEPNA